MIRGSGKGTGRNLWPRIGLAFFLWVLLFGLGVTSATAAPKAEAWSFWAANDPAGKVRVDHAPWDRLLKKYVVTNHPSGINRVRYTSVIYDWFQSDFGGSEESVLRHHQRYANPELATRLKEFGRKISHDYDWRINEQ